jgi:hypothetical protein
MGVTVTTVALVVVVRAVKRAARQVVQQPKQILAAGLAMAMMVAQEPRVVREIMDQEAAVEQVVRVVMVVAVQVQVAREENFHLLLLMEYLVFLQVVVAAVYKKVDTVQVVAVLAAVEMGVRLAQDRRQQQILAAVEEVVVGLMPEEPMQVAQVVQVWSLSDILEVLSQPEGQEQSLVDIHTMLIHQLEVTHLQQTRSNKCIKKTAPLIRVLI